MGLGGRAASVACKWHFLPTHAKILSDPNQSEIGSANLVEIFIRSAEKHGGSSHQSYLIRTACRPSLSRPGSRPQPTPNLPQSTHSLGIGSCVINGLCELCRQRRRIHRAAHQAHVCHAIERFLSWPPPPRLPDDCATKCRSPFHTHTHTPSLTLFFLSSGRA